MCKIQFNGDDEALFLAIKRKIEREFRETFTYPTLEKVFHLNGYKLRHGFVHFFGQTIHDYQEQLRVDYACELMRMNPRMRVLEIAYDAGYNERSTFYRAFRRVRGMPPGEWKNLNNGNHTE